MTWLIAGGLAMYFEAVAIAAELRDFPGGSKALAFSIMPTIEALRIIRWPADRLDTLGGYLAYHNITLFTFFLALYLGIQGSRLIRSLEERRDIDFLLATGLARARAAWIRAAATICALLLISLGLGLGTAFALEISGEPDAMGSIITLLAAGICIVPFFGLGFLLSQYFASTRVASGTTSLIIVIIYVVGNISGKYEWLRWFEYLSPFSYANRSRPVVPGFGVDYLSWIGMSIIGLVLVAIAVRIFAHRDVNSVAGPSLHSRTSQKGRRSREIKPSTLTIDMLWRQRIGLFAWPMATTIFISVFMSMMPGVIDIWAKFDFIEQFSLSGFGESVEEQYLAMVYEILPPFLAGYVISQSSIWNAEYVQGRFHLLFSTPLSWTSLLLRRILVVMVISQTMILFSIGAVVISSEIQGSPQYNLGAFRVWAMSSLFVLAFAATNALLVLLLRGRNVTQILSVYIGAAWLVGFMAPYLDWPDWIVRLSIFDAFGHPFVDWPSSTNFSVIIGMILVGITATLILGNRMSKVD
ncbi:MAG: hypothetical protein F2554_04365 [Actinobacteria bacterium]|uniref:Unannotated protein n=1 Tax=freshwater metagenome TaxID=449393 RepID=A0A6J6EKK3_9ZZZZ|nr:hypothetical protein [Actinomycetota bacterium]